MPLCAECPYDNEPSCVVKNADALALIRQLQADKIGLLESSHEIRKDMLARIQQLEDHLREATKKVKQLEAERDALYEEVRRCFYCIHVDGVLGECNQCCESCEADCPCKECDHYNKFEWRGVQKEE